MAKASCHRLPSPDQEVPLLAWLFEALRPMSKTSIKDLLKNGRVSVNDVATTQFNHPLRPGDRVDIDRNRPAPGSRALEQAGVIIAYEDDDLIILDKPAGLLTVATPNEKEDTLFARFSNHLRTRKAGSAFVVHRIDRDTSGLVLMARRTAVRDRLRENWSQAVKTYLAVVNGVPRPADGIIDNFLSENRSLRVSAVPEGTGGKRAISRYRVTAEHRWSSLVEVFLETGRKHQIRVHLAGIGCPVIGDRLYGSKSDSAPRLGLHAARLALVHPVTGSRLEVQSPLPAEVKRMLR